MRKKIDNKLYDTETATEIAYDSNSRGGEDFTSWTYYRTPEGAYFQVKQSGEFTNDLHYYRGIEALTEEEAKDALICILSSEAYDNLFTYVPANAELTPKQREDYIKFVQEGKQYILDTSPMELFYTLYGRTKDDLLSELRNEIVTYAGNGEGVVDRCLQLLSFDPDTCDEVLRNLLVSNLAYYSREFLSAPASADNTWDIATEEILYKGAEDILSEFHKVLAGILYVITNMKESSDE